MKDLTTHVPPSVRWQEGELWVFVSFTGPDGESYMVRAPAGDGRYLAERVFALVVAPAISPRALDRR